MNLLWLPLALSDRKNIYEYIDADNPSAAIAVDDRIRNSTASLKRFPEIGRPGRVAGTREFVIQRTPYIAAYRINNDTVEVLRVFHGAQRWPSNI